MTRRSHLAAPTPRREPPHDKCAILLRRRFVKAPRLSSSSMRSFHSARRQDGDCHQSGEKLSCQTLTRLGRHDSPGAPCYWKGSYVRALQRCSPREPSILLKQPKCRKNRSITKDHRKGLSSAATVSFSQPRMHARALMERSAQMVGVPFIRWPNQTLLRCCKSCRGISMSIVRLIHIDPSEAESAMRVWKTECAPLLIQQKGFAAQPKSSLLTCYSQPRQHISLLAGASL
jgi:hypothetical protein